MKGWAKGTNEKDVLSIVKMEKKRTSGQSGSLQDVPRGSRKADQERSMAWAQLGLTSTEKRKKKKKVFQ